MWNKLVEAYRVVTLWASRVFPLSVPRPLVGHMVSKTAGEELRQETDILVREIELLEHELRASRRRMRGRAADR